MSKQLQVLVDEQELHMADLEAAARSQEMPLAEWVRKALGIARRQAQSVPAAKKLAAIRGAAQHDFPTAGIEQMLAEIASGYGVSLGMIFVDSNIPMYLVGRAHPHKADAQRLLEACVDADERLVTDTEVLQEILHRYVAIDRREAIQPAFDALLGVVDNVFPVDLSVIERAKAMVLSVARLSARDALHVAVMQRHGVTRVMSFDADFDAVPGLVRVFQ